MIKKNIFLKGFSNFKIGGNAKYFLEAFNKEDLLDGLRLWQEISKEFPENKKEIFVLGGGTNILFSDEGFDGLVVKNSIDSISSKDDIVTVAAGTSVDKLLKFCIENSLSGLEWAGGLPGTVGGAVRGNAGAYQGDTKDNILEVESINLKTTKVKMRSKDECLFDYRTSIFKTGEGKDEIITFIKFNLIKGDQNLIREKIQEKINARNLRHPLEYPNVGSIFKNVPVEQFNTKQFLYELSQYVKNDPFPVIPTAKINFLAGLSGKRVGDAQLSEKHTNFIINLGNASSKDVHELINIIKQTVKEKFNINLEEEIMFVD